jgi:hypothetical protein
LSTTSPGQALLPWLPFSQGAKGCYRALCSLLYWLFLWYLTIALPFFPTFSEHLISADDLLTSFIKGVKNIWPDLIFYPLNQKSFLILTFSFQKITYLPFPEDPIPYKLPPELDLTIISPLLCDLHSLGLHWLLLNPQTCLRVALSPDLWWRCNQDTARAVVIR